MKNKYFFFVIYFHSLIQGNPGIDRFYVEIFPKGSNDETKIIWNLDKTWSHDDSVWTEAQVYLDSGEKVNLTGNYAIQGIIVFRIY